MRAHSASPAFFRDARPLAIAMALGLAMPAAAQVATDGSLGALRTIIGPQILVPSTLGRIAGANVFHSFRTFNVARGETVTFTELGTIAHIIARVTGGARSEIFGRIRVDSTSANLFLLNPSGILFGTGAAIDVPGAFYASTADALRFSDGTRFSVRIADDVTLSMAAPAAFAFNGAAAPITVSGASLAAGTRGTIGLIGGDLRIERGTGSGTLSAPGGAIGLVATRGAGEVGIGAQLQPAGFAELGRIEILNGTQVSVAEGSGAGGSGRIFIRGGEIVVDHARVDAGTRRGAGGGIEVAAEGTLTLHGAEIVSTTTGAGNAGAIRLTGRRIAIDGGTLVDTSCDPGCTTGSGGSITIAATESLAISGDASASTYVVSNSFGAGAAGHIELSAPAIDLAGASFVQSVATASGGSLGISIAGDELNLSGGAQVDASSRGAGAGGPIEVNARRVRIEGARVDPQGAVRLLPSGFFSNAEGRGNAGTITVHADRVRILGGGEISSSASAGSSGHGGVITLVIGGELEVSGQDSTSRSGGIFTNTFSTGDAGDIVIRARSVILQENGLIQSQTAGAGNGGRILVSADDVSILSGAQMATSANSTGNAGSIELRLAGTLRIEGIETGIFANASEGTGNGGSIDVVADTIRISGGGLIDSESVTSGNGGNIRVHALSHLEIGEQGGLIATSDHSGLTGDIVVRSDGTFTLTGRVSTTAELSDGGNITISTGGLALLDGGLVQTRVSVTKGEGNGGNITLDTPTLVLRDSFVNANAYGGKGGNIHIAAPTFILSPASRVTASSTLGIEGTILIDSPAIDLSGALTPPLPRYLDADAILSGRCSARLAGKASSLAFAAREELRDSARTYFLARAGDASAVDSISPEQCTPPASSATPR